MRFIIISIRRHDDNITVLESLLFSLDLLMTAFGTNFWTSYLLSILIVVGGENASDWEDTTDDICSRLNSTDIWKSDNTTLEEMEDNAVLIITVPV